MLFRSIQEEIGGTLLSLEVSEPYSSDYDQCLERAADEKADKARPLLVNSPESIDDYDVIFLGYPNWWYTAPMAIFSFLEQYDFTGKQVILFCAHGTGGLASSVRDIKAAIPKDTIVDNVIGLYREDMNIGQEKISQWLKQIQ